MIVDERFFRKALEAERRYHERRHERQDTERKLDEKQPLEQIDESGRVAKRLARLEAKGLQLRDDQILERTLGGSDFMPISYLQLGLRVARSVARIWIRTQQNRTLGYGTGFLVSRRLLLTNNHVLQDESEAVNSLAQFNYQHDLGISALSPVEFRLDPKAFFLTNGALDYTLVAVTEIGITRQNLSTFGWLPLIEEEGKAILGEYLSIIQHPRGEVKQLAARENRLIDLLPNFLHYHTDTEPGSSGSPVFNDQWEVVGLHHSGVPERDQNGTIIGWLANEGVRVSQLVKHIRSADLSDQKDHFRREMFAPLAHQLPEVEPPSVPKEIRRSDARSPFHPQTRDDGSVVWSIPLEISVKLRGRVETAVISEEPRSDRPTPPDQDTRVTQNKELRAALDEFKEASRRTYYQEGKDKADRNAYYQNIDISLAGSQMFQALHSLVSDTHHTKPRYKPGAEVYPWVDLQPSLKLKSIYSGEEFDPEDIITEAFQIEHELAERTKLLQTRESTLGTERLKDSIEMLEASLPYNCEHSVPQSWFEKKEPMRGDLHHLFTCESKCNSFRGNTPYFDFPEEQEVVRDDCGRREKDAQGTLPGFEPHAGKGEIARATLYFLLRYPGEINRRSEFTIGRIPILVSWHKNFPVSAHEKHRNMAIFTRQGNRNPLIDHPEWIDRIDFVKGLGG